MLELDKIYLNELSFYGYHEMKKSFYKQEWQRQDKGFRDWHSRGLHSETRPVHPSMTEEKFAEAVNTIKDYISAGDVFQVNRA